MKGNRSHAIPTPEVGSRHGKKSANACVSKVLEKEADGSRGRKLTRSTGNPQFPRGGQRKTVRRRRIRLSGEGSRDCSLRERTKQTSRGREVQGARGEEADRLRRRMINKQLYGGGKKRERDYGARQHVLENSDQHFTQRVVEKNRGGKRRLVAKRRVTEGTRERTVGFKGVSEEEGKARGGLIIRVENDREETQVEGGGKRPSRRGVTLIRRGKSRECRRKAKSSDQGTKLAKLGVTRV